MAGIFQDVLKGFLGSDYLKDYRHANKTFTSAGYANSPRLKYLFHVYFNVNTVEIPQLSTLFGARDLGKVSVLTKSVELPKYSFEVETLNQYNRKRNVQQKINYEPIVIDFHDDAADTTRSLWYTYYDYYYSDPSQPYNNNQALRNTTNRTPLELFNLRNTYGPQQPQNNTRGNQGSQTTRDIYAPDSEKIGNDWGYSAESAQGPTGTAMQKPLFFRDITIYGFNQKSFVSYTLINPMITDFQHDRYDYAEGNGTMANSMTLKYESVKYGQGAIGSDGVPGFAEPAHYDTEPSRLSRPGSTNSLLGQGGVLDAGVGVFEDLSSGNILGAATKAGRLFMNKDNISLKGVKEEVLNETRRAIASGAAVNAVNKLGTFIPTRKSLTKPVTISKTNQPVIETGSFKNRQSLIKARRDIDTSAENTNATVRLAGLAPGQSPFVNPDA